MKPIDLLFRELENCSLGGDFRVSCHAERTCSANQAGENSSFIFTVCVKSVPRYHFELAYEILQMAVKEFFETDFQKW